MIPIDTIKVVVLCRDQLVRAGLRDTLQAESDFQLLPNDWQSFGRHSLHESGVELVVADYEHALELLEDCRATGPMRHGWMPNVLIVTHRDSEGEIRHALEAGVRGYLILGCGLDELVRAARSVRRGIRYVGMLAAQRLADSVACSSLTFREMDVLRLVVKGHSNKVVARQLDIAIGTVKSHLKSIFEKLDATSRTEVAAVAEERGLLALPSGVAHGTHGESNKAALSELAMH
jgi:DNA-binding NarL/FixJ family response regulator